MNEDWHSMSIDEVYAKLDSSSEGLSEKEAHRRLEKYGEKKIEEGEEISPIRIFIEQFQDFLI